MYWLSGSRMPRRGRFTICSQPRALVPHLKSFWLWVRDSSNSCAKTIVQNARDLPQIFPGREPSSSNKYYLTHSQKVSNMDWKEYMCSLVWVCLYALTFMRACVSMSAYKSMCACMSVYAWMHMQCKQMSMLRRLYIKLNKRTVLAEKQWVDVHYANTGCRHSCIALRVLVLCLEWCLLVFRCTHAVIHQVIVEL